MSYANGSLLLTAEAGQASGFLERRVKKLGFSVLVFLLATAVFACSHIPKIKRPYILISFPGVDFFIEDAEDIEVVSLEEGTLRFAQDQGFPAHRFTAAGTGSFTLRGHLCHVGNGQVKCDGLVLGVDLGGVLLRRDGEFLPVNPLTVSAK